MRYYFILLLFLIHHAAFAQLFSQEAAISPEDTLKARNHQYRNWWDVTKYDIMIEPNFKSETLSGVVIIDFKITDLPEELMMQIDLHSGLTNNVVTLSNRQSNMSLSINDGQMNRSNDFLFIDLNNNRSDLEKLLRKDSVLQLTLIYSGKPLRAVSPPWDGGFIFSKDEKGRPWISAAVQGKGCSSWFPCKDYLGDEPDDGVKLSGHVMDGLGVLVSNGRNLGTLYPHVDNWVGYTWETQAPINNYNIIPYIGHYKSFSDSLQGEKGTLSLDYYVIDYNLDAAKKQFGEQVKPMLEAFEYWMGPYPFYEDGFKVVETPYAGMEHQSAIAYGNGFKNGYNGHDVSGSGWGKKFDYILVHETAHEWFGNNVSTKDLSDLWVHESFATYAEVLYVERIFGKQAALEYMIGTRRSIANKSPIKPPYGMNKEGSGDMYWKGSNMIHTLRLWIGDDEKFRSILKAMNQTFYHKTIDGADVEEFWKEQSGLPLDAFFDQYLRKIDLPVLEYKEEGDYVWYRWKNTSPEFALPLKMDHSNILIHPTLEWQQIEIPLKKFKIDPAYLINTLKVK